MADSHIDTANDSFVGVQGDQIVFAVPPPLRLSKAKALRLAAWIVALAEEEDGAFARLLAAVQGT